MNVIVPRLSGFCPGVKSAEKRLFELKDQFPDEPIYIYGYVINNRRYIEYLEKQNVHTEEDLTKIPKNAIVVIRTHGINRHSEQQLQKAYRVIDLTCGKVKQVQNQIYTHAQNGFFIVVSGKKNHPEVKGLISYADHFAVIETKDDLESFLLHGKSLIETNKMKKIFIISQTTGDRDLFDQAISGIRKKRGGDFKIEYSNSICPVTDKKEQEALLLQKEVEIAFVVGDKLSSNAKKLYRILSNGSSAVYFIEDKDELESLHLPLSNYRDALVVSSASTPVFVEKEVCEYLSLIRHSDGNLV